MSTKTETGIARMKEIFEGAAGVRSIIYIFLFIAAGFSLYFGMKGAIDKASAQASRAEIVALENNRVFNDVDGRLDMF